MPSICVFCASSERIDSSYKTQATALGHLLSDLDFTLVYGGARIGLMGAVADAMLAQKSQVIGVIPEHLKDKEVAHDGLTELHITQTMQERQTKMADLADGFIVLPGGLGTLAEFFEVLTWKSLELHEKPIFLLNHAGYWDPMLEMFGKMQREKVLYEEISTLFSIISTLEDLKIALDKGFKS